VGLIIDNVVDAGGLGAAAGEDGGGVRELAAEDGGGAVGLFLQIKGLQVMLEGADVDLGVANILALQSGQKGGRRKGFVAPKLQLHPLSDLEQFRILALVLQDRGDIDKVEGGELIELQQVIVEVVRPFDEVVHPAAVGRN
jgi:hypothetical protein